MSPTNPGPAGPTRPRRGTPTLPDATTAGAERAFFVREFHGITIVVSLPELGEEGLAAVARTVRGFEAGDTRFVLVAPDEPTADRLRTATGGPPVLVAPTTWHDDELARLWVTTTDARVVVLVAPGAGAVARTAGQVAAGLGASKVVLTDPAGGWGDPPRSFVDLDLTGDELGEALGARGSSDLLEAARTALRGGAYSVNLCRAEDLERELFTFDGAGTLLTLGGYVHLTELRVDDLPAVERLVAQGVADGVLKPRSRTEVARTAVTGLGARVVRTGHLAGVVGLETAPYRAERIGEVSALITVSEFSGAGSGGLLVDGLVARAERSGLRALFAVTVSDEAARFFVRRGFREVPQDAVPATKWQGYDADRLARARCFWRDVV